MNRLYASDLHLRDDVPRCRQQTPEEWTTTQLNKIDEIVNVANEHDACLVIVGDIFHRWNVGERILNGLIASLMRLNHYALIMRGNHDMKHRDNNVEHTAFGNLQAYSKSMGKIRMAESELAVLPYGKFEKADIKSPGKAGALLIHQLCFPKKKDIPPMVTGAVGADTLMSTFDEYDLIVCGDGHNPFHSGFVVNCGSIFQQSVNETHEPSVWLHEESGSVTRIKLRKDLTPIVEDRYADVVAARDARFDAFVELLESVDTAELSWEDAVYAAMQSAKLGADTTSLIKDIMEKSRG